MRYSELDAMSPQEFKAKYSLEECRALDAKLDQLEATDLNQILLLSQEEKNRLDEFIHDLGKVEKYQMR